MQMEQAVGPRIKRISNALDRKRTQDMDSMALTSSQAFVLGYLTRHRDQSVSPGDLGRHFDLSQPTVTGILQRLEAKGFIRYAAHETDRRKKQIRVTDKALEIQQQVHQRFLETEALITQGMSPTELETLLALLDRVIANIGQIDGLDPCRRPKEETK